MQDLNEVFKDFSNARLLTYKHFLRFELGKKEYTPEQIYHLYAWNEMLSGVFWLLLSRIEITLRNRINDIFVEKFGKYWLDASQYHNITIPKFSLRKHIKNNLKKPNKNLKTKVLIQVMIEWLQN